MAATMDLEIEQLDVNTTFLHGELEEEDIYGAARGFHGCRQGALSLQIEEELVWLEASSSAVVQEV